MPEVLALVMGAVLRASLDASILCLLILALKGLLGRRWPARWQAALWLTLVLRLCLPAPLVVWRFAAVLPAIQAQAPARPPLPPVQASRPVPTRGSLPIPLRRGRPSPFAILPVLWLAGALMAAAFLASGALRFWLAVRRGRVVTSEAALRLLESTKREMGVRTLVGLVETDRVRAPALFGFLRPRLLVPQGFLNAFDAEELHDIFRHELAHLQRQDIPMGWLVCLLQAVHWFNPLIWYAFLQWRRDRELACDETAVRHLDAPATARYGHTLLRLFERLKGPGPLPNLAGVFETPSNLSRRILMISRLAQGQERHWPIASLLVLGGLTVLSVGGLARAADRPAPVPAGATPPAKAPWLGFANDADLLGGWRTVDFVQRVEDFIPGQRQGKEPDYIREMFFHADGTGREFCADQGASPLWKWTRGKIYAGSPTEGRYEIHQVAGRTFLFFQWMNDDVLFRGHKPHWVVLEKAPGLREVLSRVRDRTNYPFEADPACLGRWVSVDFVARIEDFKPSERRWKGDLFLRDLEFLPQGKTNCAFRWTRGLLLHDGDHTASRYEIREMDGSRYLFMEWKSGDYLRGNRTPSYYVLKAQ